MYFSKYVDEEETDGGITKITFTQLMMVVVDVIKMILLIKTTIFTLVFRWKTIFPWFITVKVVGDNVEREKYDDAADEDEKYDEDEIEIDQQKLQNRTALADIPLQNRMRMTNMMMTILRD